MSKVISEQVKKAESLIAGLRKHPEIMGKVGVNEQTLAALESESKLLGAQNEELEQLEAKRSEVSRAANGKLVAIRTQFQTLKRTVKLNTDPAKWAQVGILDKK
ncbi:MAG: hypothetical protein LBR50_03415 [Tannerella sp.]|jgi:4-hydroxy-3-methylbut-2-enyl diphosphate reductase IspH|nr:hypothetical protein [Tannerella sp.]